MRAITGLVLLCLCAMVACTPGSGGLSGPARNAEFLNGALKVSPPRGYCIDGTASQSHEDSAVVLMGRCTDAAPVVPAVLSLTVGQAGTSAVLAAGGQALSDYFTSDSGRAAVARSGRASDVRILEAFGKGPEGGGAFVLHLSDRTVGDYWRAVVGVRGRLVTVSVTPPEDQPLPPAAGRDLLEQVLTGLVQANIVTSVP